MIPILYDSNETAFVSNGLCRLKDIISCTVTEERNSIYECNFEYPVTGANYDLIQCGRIIAVTHDETGDIQPFDIVSFSRPINGVVTFHAVHISYRQSKLTVSGTNISSLTDALTLLTTAKPTNPFGYWTDKTSDALFAAADGVPRSVKQMLGGTEGSILDCYGGEYEWDKWTVRLWNARGRAREFTIRYGVNMMSYDEDVDYSDTYTACIPFWTGSGENSESIVITGNMVSSGVVPYNGREACIPLNLTDKFETQPTSAQLEELAYKLMADKNVFIPAQTIRVQFTRLQDSPDYENYASLMECSLCDSVNVMFSDYDVSGSFKIVKTTWNVLKDRFDEMELGTLSVTLQSALDTSGTSPSVSDVTIIKAAAEAQNTANIANGILISMDEAARAANTTLEGIYADAETSKNLLADMEDAATAAQTTLTGIYADAETAKTQAASALSSASTALTAAQSAQANADAALVSLSNVEDVVGVLEWITAHGTMIPNGSTALDPAKVYFIVDPNGDYVVGGTHYSIVSEPKAEDRTDYYTLSIDESVQNYVATHVVVDTEGLWLIPDAGGNKVLIATGAGSSYPTAGTYIIGKVNGVDTIFAKFTTDGVTMNATNSTQIAHLGYGVGTAQSGTATAPYYTLGLRLNNSTVGNYSVAEGRNTTASGYCSHAEGGPSGSPNDGPVASGESSHAEGSGTLSSGKMAHAEGRYTEANGVASHAQNEGTIANGASQTALGKYNVADTTSAVILGNGTADNARSNALTIDWSGNVNIPSGANYCINNVPISGGGGGGDVTGVKGDAESTYRTGDVNLTPANIGAVPTIRTVNGKALSSNITLSASDVSALPSSTVIPTITDTYSGTSSDGMSGKAVKSAIDALDGSVTGTVGSGKTLTAFSQTDGKVSATFGDISITKSQISDFPSLATVATSGSYNDLSNKPTIPTVNNATLTIQKNGTTVNTFTANASSNVTADISVPTTTSDLVNDSGFITSTDLPKEYDFTSSLTPSIDARGVSRAQYAIYPSDTSSLTSANGLKISAYLDYNGTIFYPLSVVYVEINASLGKFNIYVKSFRDSVQSTSATYVSGTLHIVAPFQISSVSTYK